MHDISYSLWPSFWVLSFTGRRPLLPRHRVMAPAHSVVRGAGCPNRLCPLMRKSIYTDFILMRDPYW
jgi:hypothetical protein